VARENNLKSLIPTNIEVVVGNQLIASIQHWLGGSFPQGTWSSLNYPQSAQGA
jgi:hypothetical protein